MKENHGQKLLSRDNIYFDLKSIRSEMNGDKAFVLTDGSFEDSYLPDYFRELGVETLITRVDNETDFSRIREFGRSFRDSGCSLIVAEGSSDAIQAGKLVKLFSGADPEKDLSEQLPVQESAPMLAIPSTIERGCEANGIITITIDGKLHSFNEAAAVPEYILFDGTFVRFASGVHRNECLAGAIGSAANIFWTQPEDSSQYENALEGLRIILDNMMECLRDDSSAYPEMLHGAYLIGCAVGEAGSLSIESFVRDVCRFCDVSYNRALLLMQSPLAMAIEDRFYDAEVRTLNDRSFEAKGIKLDSLLDESAVDLYYKLQSISRIFLPGDNGLSAFRRQIMFYEQLLEMDVFPDIEDDRIREYAASIDEQSFADWPAQYTADERLLIVLQLFHRFSVPYFLYICARKPEKRARKLENAQEQYPEAFENNGFIPDPFYIKRIERRAFVKGLQELTLETLVLTRDFLQENGLRFYLSEGTLLGAVRHRGFIPWDDDVDIMMPREDYDKLVELAAEGKVPPELNFDALENNPKHWVLGAKMQLTRQTQYIQHKVTNLSKYNGPYVDVFPLDYWNSPHTKKQYRAQRMVKMCRRLLFMKTGYSRKTKRKWHRKLMRMAVPFIPHSIITRFAIWNMKKFFSGSRKYFVHLCSYYPYHKEVFPISMFGEPLTMKFEGYDMPVPNAYDYMLRTIYGNKYDKLPPPKVTKMRRHAFELIEEPVEDDEV